MGGKNAKEFGDKGTRSSDLGLLADKIKEDRRSIGHRVEIVIETKKNRFDLPPFASSALPSIVNSIDRSMFSGINRHLRPTFRSRLSPSLSFFLRRWLRAKDFRTVIFQSLFLETTRDA